MMVRIRGSGGIHILRRSNRDKCNEETEINLIILKVKGAQGEFPN